MEIKNQTLPNIFAFVKNSLGLKIRFLQCLILPFMQF